MTSTTSTASTAASSTTPASWPLYLSLLAALLVSSPLHSPLNNPNEGVRVFTVKALVDEHTFTIDHVVRRWGFIDDKARCRAPGAGPDDRSALCASKAPFVSLVAAAAYGVVKASGVSLERDALTRLCRLAGGALPAALCFVIGHRALRRRAEHGGDAVLVDVVSAAVVVSSGVCASVHVFSGHALAALAPFAVLALWLRDLATPQATTLRTLALATALLFAATSAEYPAALSVPLLLPLWWRCERRAYAAVVVVVVALITLAPTAFAHQVMYGAPWRTGYSSLENPQYQPLVAGTFFGIALPKPAVWFTVLFSPELGLVVFAPIVVLGAAGLWSLLKSGEAGARRGGVVIVGVLVAFLLFIGGFKGYRGGWSVGPRYIAELVGVGGACAVVVRARARSLAIAAAAAGFATSGVASATFPHLPDVFRNPVPEFVVPLVVRGFAPDSAPLVVTRALGLAPGWALAVVLVVVAAPIVVAARGAGRARVALLAAPLSVAMLAALSVVPAFATEPAARAREVRRMADNWRPTDGVPFVYGLGDGVDNAGGDDGIDAAALAAGRSSGDVRVDVGLDRARFWKKRPLRCLPGRQLPRHADVGAAFFVDVIGEADAAGDVVVVVDDALADHIGPAGGRVVVVAAADLMLWGGLWCADRAPAEVWWLARAGLPPPAALRDRTADAPRGVASGFTVTRLR